MGDHPPAAQVPESRAPGDQNRRLRRLVVWSRSMGPGRYSTLILVAAAMITGCGTSNRTTAASDGGRGDAPIVADGGADGRVGDAAGGAAGDDGGLNVVPVNVAGIAPGQDDTCAQLVAGTVRCWGDNADGEVGDGTTVQRTLPTVVPGLSKVAQGAVGVDSTCARLTDGTVQ